MNITAIISHLDNYLLQAGNKVRHENGAVIIWNMIVKRLPYNNDHDYEFLDQKRKRKVKEMKKLIYEFDITTNELGLQMWNL